MSKWLTKSAVWTWTEFKKESHLSERTRTVLKDTHSMWSTHSRWSTNLKIVLAHLNWVSKGLALQVGQRYCQTHSSKTIHKNSTILNQLTKFWTLMTCLSKMRKSKKNMTLLVVFKASMMVKSKMMPLDQAAWRSVQSKGNSHPFPRTLKWTVTLVFHN